MSSPSSAEEEDEAFSQAACRRRHYDLLLFLCRDPRPWTKRCSFSDALSNSMYTAAKATSAASLPFTCLFGRIYLRLGSVHLCSRGRGGNGLGNTQNFIELFKLFLGDKNCQETDFLVSSRKRRRLLGSSSNSRCRKSRLLRSCRRSRFFFGFFAAAALFSLSSASSDGEDDEDDDLFLRAFLWDVVVGLVLCLILLWRDQSHFLQR